MQAASRHAFQSWTCTARRALLAGGCALLACRGPGPPPLADYERHEGNSCAYAPSECADAHSLWECRDRAWVVVDCDEVCADEGGAAGCLVDASADAGARCWCAAFAPACAPGAQACASEQEIRVCRADTLQYEVLSCDAVCAGREPPHLSLGCDDFDYDGCGCTLEGTPCAETSAPHCEYDALVTCIDGLWVIEPCDLHGPGGTCDPFAEGGAACVDNDP